MYKITQCSECTRIEKHAFVIRIDMCTKHWAKHRYHKIWGYKQFWNSVQNAPERITIISGYANINKFPRRWYNIMLICWMDLCDTDPHFWYPTDTHACILKYLYYTQGIWSYHNSHQSTEHLVTNLVDHGLFKLIHSILPTHTACLYTSTGLVDHNSYSMLQ